MLELLIDHNSKLYEPLVPEGVEWSTERRGAPGKLSFKVVEDSKLKLTEGDSVRVKLDDKKVFYGFVFQKKCNKERIYDVIAYDQIRYLQNKDTIVYEKKKASQFIKMSAGRYGLKTGILADTKYVIPSRVEENTSILEMYENALDKTLTNTGNMFILFDEFGELVLKNLEDMKVHKGKKYLQIDETGAQNYDYTSSIDKDTYNRVKLTYDNEKKGKREVYIAQNGKNINKWGLLQYFDTIKKGENGKAKAEALLKLYNAKTRMLQIKDAVGDIRVRGGSLVLVNFDLGDVKLSNFMLVEKCTHKFKNNEHWMDLTLRGGDFIA